METPAVNEGIVSVRILFLILPIIMGALHCFWRRHTPGFSKVECFLAYFLLIGVGFQSLLVGHLEIYHPNLVVAYLGWENTPFLLELGKSNIAWGILGILSFWIRGGWRSATALGYGLFLMMTSIDHYRYFIYNNHAYHTMLAPLIYTNIALALCLFVLLAMRRFSQP